MSQGNIQYRLSLDNAQFTRALAGAQNAIKMGMAKTAAVVAGAGLSIAGAMHGVKSAIQLGGELSDLAAQTGETAGDVLVLRQAFMDAGISAQMLPTSLALLSKSLSGVSEDGQSTKEVFARMGLDINKLRSMGAAEQFDQIGKAINKLPAQADKAAAAMKIFGRSGAPMLRLFDDPKAFETARASLGSMPDVVDKTNLQFDKIGDAFGRLSTKISGLWSGVLIAFIPVMERISDWLDSIDLAGIGVKIGAVFSVLAEMFSDGSLGQLLSTALIAGLQHAVNFLSRASTAFVNGLSAYLVSLPQILGKLFGMLGDRNFWMGLVNVAIGAFETLGSVLLRIFVAPLSYLGAGIDVLINKLFNAISKVPGLSHFRQPEESYKDAVERRKKELAENSRVAKEDGAKRTQQGLAAIESPMEGLLEQLAGTVSSVKDAAVAGWDTPDVFQNTESMSRMGEYMADVKKRLAGKIEETMSAADGGKGKQEQQGGGSVAVGSGAGPKILTDRLARMGGFIGGTVNDPARRSVAAAEKQVTLLQQILQVQRGSKLGAYYM